MTDLVEHLVEVDSGNVEPSDGDAENLILFYFLCVHSRVQRNDLFYFYVILV